MINNNPWIISRFTKFLIIPYNQIHQRNCYSLKNVKKMDLIKFNKN